MAPHRRARSRDEVALADRRVTLFFELARSLPEDCSQAIDRAHAYWSSLDWANEGMAYRKHVIKNFSRLMHYFYEERIDDIRQQTPNTRLEADKDFWEAKRAADHLEGNVEKAMKGELVPTMASGQTYWKDAYIPAGVCTVITPMNFVYGIPGIQIAGCYLSGSPMIFKGHPFSAITSTTLVKMLLAAGADPRAVHKLEGFGGDIKPIVEDERIAVVSVTGSAETAKTLQSMRGVRPVRFEGGGCNYSWIDDGFSDEELKKIGRDAPRLLQARPRLAQVHQPARHRGEQGGARPHRADDRRRDEDVAAARPAHDGRQRDEDREPGHGAQGQHREQHSRSGAGRRRESAARRRQSERQRIRGQRGGRLAGGAGARHAANEAHGWIGTARRRRSPLR